MEICLFRPEKYPLNPIKVKLNKVVDISYKGITIQKYFMDIDGFMKHTCSVLPDPRLAIPEIVLFRGVPLIFSPSELLTTTNKVKVITHSSTANWFIVDSRYSLPPSLIQGTICRHLIDMMEEYKALKLVESL